MSSPTRSLILAASIGLFGFAPGSAEAQSGNAWGGYAPGYAWGSYAPPQPYTVVTPAPSPSPNVGWQGYQPAAAWQGYQPGTAWRGFQPGQAVRTAPATRAYSAPRAPAHYREYGTGRNVFMHKPWLPGQS